MSDFNPLVSIVVITYNSSEYVLETLESAKAQTYQNIELIITDDGSTDGTVELCRKWLSENQTRFIRTELITVPKNTGIPANCNRGYRACHGEWIKGIAGDDVLLPLCIERLVICIQNNPAEFIIVSNEDVFGKEENETNGIRVKIWLEDSIQKLKKLNTAQSQYKNLCHSNFIPAPTSFIKKELLEKLDFWDEEIKLIEDYPFWLKATKNNYRLFFLDEILVRYRVGPSSIRLQERSKLALKLVYCKYIDNNIFYRLLLPYINQISVTKRDRFLLFILRITSFPLKFFRK